ncbi:MAG TPA: hypothetical protein VMI56_25680 [Reyranella sp.]|nr:hypothetical protein [Reyranella sp.]
MKASRNRRLLWASLGALALAGSAAVFTSETAPDPCDVDPMPWRCASPNTAGRLEKQLRDHLPIGTPQPAVEAYLQRLEIPYQFGFTSYPSFKKPIEVTQRFPADWWNNSVYISIYFDANGGVEKINFSITWATL